MEVVDTLKNGYKIIQDSEKFKFGIDAILLSHFAFNQIRNNEKVIDLGTGNGIIPLMIAKSRANSIVGLEIQEENVELAKRSVELNQLEEKIQIIHGDIKAVDKKFTKHSFDVVVSNPPYMINEHGKQNPTEAKSIARHEYEVYYNGEKVGIITSGGVSPMLNANIAMAYVKNIKEICAGAVVQVMIREKLHDAEVVKRPFVAKRNKVKKEK